MIFFIDFGQLQTLYALSKIYLKNNLTCIAASSCFLVQTIIQQETQNMPLSKSLRIVGEAQNKLEKA